MLMGRTEADPLRGFEGSAQRGRGELWQGHPARVHDDINWFGAPIAFLCCFENKLCQAIRTDRWKPQYELVELALGQQPGLFDQEASRAGFSEAAVVGLRRHDHPCMALPAMARRIGATGRALARAARPPGGLLTHEPQVVLCSWLKYTCPQTDGGPVKSGSAWGSD